MRRTKLRRNKKADNFEKTAEDIVDSYFLLVFMGEKFSFSSGKQIIRDVAQKEEYMMKGFQLKHLNQPIEKYLEKRGHSGGLGQKNSDLFYGFWGTVYNEILNLPVNENMLFLSKWRKIFFDDEDIRFQDKKKLKEMMKLQHKQGDGNGINPEDYDFDKWRITDNPSSRFFVVSGNIDHSIVKTGHVHEEEYYEVDGNIREWQCSKKCHPKGYLIDDDFRFSIDKDSGSAPSIKFVDKVNSIDDSLTSGGTGISSSSTLSDEYEEDYDNLRIQGVGDMEEYNFKHPRGMFDYSHVKPTAQSKTPLRSQKKFLTKEICNKRGNYFRHFNPQIAQQTTNPTFFSSDFLGNQSGSTGGGERKHSKTANEILTSFDETDIFSNNLSAKNAKVKYLHIVNRKNLPKGNNDNMKKKKEDQYLRIDKKFHDDHHDGQKSSSSVDQGFGIFKSFVIDPMIHHHSYLSEIVDSTKIQSNLVFSGSKNEFNVSVRVTNLEPTTDLSTEEDDEPLLERVGEVKKKKKSNSLLDLYIPHLSTSIIKKNESTEEYHDSIIINIKQQLSGKETLSPTHKVDEDKENGKTRPIFLSENGSVSVIVEPINSKTQFSRQSGNVGESVNLRQLPWQMVGEYSIKHRSGSSNNRLGLNGSSSDSISSSLMGGGNPSDSGEGSGISSVLGGKKKKKRDEQENLNDLLIDYVLFSENTHHKITLRTVQHHESGQTELVNLFIDLPVSNFHKNTSKLDSLSGGQSGGSIPTLTKLDETPKPSNDIPTGGHVSFTPLPEHALSLLKSSGFGKEEKTPVLNRIICPTCHSLSRPRVKMLGKDPFWLRTPVKRYKNWIKNTVKTLQENNKTNLLILELGCGPKLRKISETLYKQTKMYDTKLVRIGPKKLTLKKKDQKEDENILLITEPCPRSMKKIAEHVRNLAEKIDAPYDEIDV